MKSRPAWHFLSVLALVVSAGTAGVACADESFVGGHELDAAVALSTDANCPDRGRATAPKPSPKPKQPESEPGRERPPASLPCCNGADCSCSGPPALA